VNHLDVIVARLEADWPSWHVWAVPKAVGGYTWCAHRRDDEKRVLNAGTPGELEERLAGEEG
jgi:hypothetical protein